MVVPQIIDGVPTPLQVFFPVKALSGEATITNVSLWFVLIEVRTHDLPHSNTLTIIPPMRLVNIEHKSLHKHNTSVESGVNFSFGP